MATSRPDPTQQSPTQGRGPASRLVALLGPLAFTAGLIALASTAMIGLTSFTAFNPPDLVRVITMAPFPLALSAAAGFGAAALLHRSGRGWAAAGLALAALSLAGFVAIVAAGS